LLCASMIIALKLAFISYPVMKMYIMLLSVYRLVSEREVPMLVFLIWCDELVY
jgi:hypothetical protein